MSRRSDHASTEAERQRLGARHRRIPCLPLHVSWLPQTRQRAGVEGE